ncbi:hypothetical protein KVP06_03980 [Geobacter sulfurreducens]|jgi:hypothetical protein|uniref:Uncharacterized protein n=1 Tax=Geobacter sulfurreducens (strain ATCC 51573 / DSM 12127 / PCA) TaxID=243231 RepID=Q74F21_GEOSL|nr:hypothetical protein [Geobacter sulfurreducens]AAR34118.1 hypothetical protein GSU0788 [Geobacter sulfurreducens PCA]ADI83631.1 hypothetical protein KN400_0768 [Geobacter sulfurreducens KN400]AJY70532.1 hypothetical protein RW64_13585 [Geobacter sulfurreducens]UAC04854.1 hypothetical protein KVP06_03980 [Geobacter sulfurreducens]UTG93480.1 hypothetical protein J8622_03890 [Geobacter sulfurreducens]
MLTVIIGAVALFAAGVLFSLPEVHHVYGFGGIALGALLACTTLLAETRALSDFWSRFRPRGGGEV